jgi:hypothetical protein
MSRAAGRKSVERLKAIVNARLRIAYGKHFPLRQLAGHIAVVRQMLLEEYGTVLSAVDALYWSAEKALDTLYWSMEKEPDGINQERKELMMLARVLGTRLFQVAIASPKYLGKIAEALWKLDPGAVDPRAEAILTAYEECGSFPPAFSELKRAFIARFGESRWRGDYSVRKTLRSLGLPLSKSKRGRPPGAKSVLKMQGTPQQRRKN